MRRSIATAVALTMSLTVLSAVGAAADARPSVVDPLSGVTGTAAGDGALTRARAVLEGTAEAGASGDQAPTLALRDLFVALPRLDPDERQQAHGLLARPTDGADDKYDDGYTVEAKRDCSRRICVHWVDRTKDAAARRWVDRTMTVMRDVWAQEVRRLGYRRPVNDHKRGGNKKFDVYLKDVGSEGFYGYCVPERRKPGHRWQASGYCVLDNDFTKSQFDGRPGTNLRVTAAHEFFHAIQFAYDYAEDGWLLESTATWVEERVADDVDDNRQYLAYGQVRKPHQPLDRYRQSGFGSYGNWAFFEYLSQRYGAGIVRRVWSNATGKPRNYSTRAVRRALPDGTTFAEVFRAYAAANVVPRRSYAEGAAWPAAPMARKHTLTGTAVSATGSVRVDHMASKNVAVRPARSMRNPDWRLRISVDGPSAAASPAAYLLVHRTSGAVKRRPVTLDADGRGRVEVRFGARSVKRVTLTLANASTRFDCWHERLVYSCQGKPLVDDRTFAYRVRAIR
jgi:hypothetical protein